MPDESTPDTLPESIEWATLQVDVADQLTPGTLVDAWSCAGRGSSDGAASIKMVTRTIGWQEGDDVPPFPEWSDPVPLERDLIVGTTAVVKTKLDGDVDTVTTYSRTQFRFLWKVPDAGPGVWRFVYLRHRYQDKSYVNDSLNGDADAGLPYVPTLWTGEEPEDYDEADNTTWPGSAEIDAGLPSAPTAPDPEDEGDSTSSRGDRLLRLIWPRSTMPLPTNISDVLSTEYAPGVIPGDGYAWFHEPVKMRLQGGGWWTLRIPS